VYSNNDKPDKPVKLLYIDKINALGSVINMVKTGESNIGFMIEVVRANWPMSFKNAETIVLEGVIAAKNN
jgi:hypothetical protein